MFAACKHNTCVAKCDMKSKSNLANTRIALKINRNIIGYVKTVDILYLILYDFCTLIIVVSLSKYSSAIRVKQMWGNQPWGTKE